MMNNPLPSGFLKEMADLLGEEESRRLADALDTPPATSVRFNTRKGCDTSVFGIDTEPVKWCPEGVYLPHRPVFTSLPQLHAGAFYVQDASSMVHSHIIKSIARSGIRVLDLCAAPGGKTTAAISQLADDCVVVANEIVPARARILQENLRKWGRPEVIVTSAKPSELSRAGIGYDIIMADVPCSGEGMMRKDEDARGQWSEGLVARCASLQREIISDIIGNLNPGGYLVYSTCTFNPEENERNVRWMMDEYGLENPEIDVNEEWGIGMSRMEGVNALRFMPHITRGEGLFAALLRKPEGAAPVGSRLSRLKVESPVKSPCHDWVRGEMDIYSIGNRLHAMGRECARTYSALRQIKGGILDAGVEIGEVKGKDIIPSVGLALNIALDRDVFQEVEVNRETALAYLKREPVTLPADTPAGFVLLTYDRLPLGFVKNLGNRTNNLYPKEWRVHSIK